jgi:hypothetical protein
MTREESYKEIEHFCKTPKTSREVARHLNIEPPLVYGYLSRLQRRGKLKKIGASNSKTTPAVFTTVDYTPPRPIEGTNPIIAHAHNPFGLRL